MCVYSLSWLVIIFLWLAKHFSMCGNKMVPMSDGPSWNVAEVVQLVDVDVFPAKSSLLISVRVFTAENTYIYIH